jgi:hypothetical protein
MPYCVVGQTLPERRAGGNKMQQKYAADPKTAEEIHTFVKDYEKDSTKTIRPPSPRSAQKMRFRLDRKDQFAVRKATEEKYANLFQQWHPGDIVCTIDQVSAIGNISWNSGGWTCTLQGENGPLTVKGYRLDVLVREGDVWKECISCSTPAAPEPK